MHDNTEKTSPGNKFRLFDFEKRCRDCHVAVGVAHLDGCDVAQCLVTGRQRLMCDLDHDCGHHEWTGWVPGQRDCERLGWMLGPGMPDFVRLYTEATWDPALCAWVQRPDH